MSSLVSQWTPCLVQSFSPKSGWEILYSSEDTSSPRTSSTPLLGALTWYSKLGRGRGHGGLVSSVMGQCNPRSL